MKYFSKKKLLILSLLLTILFLTPGCDTSKTDNRPESLSEATLKELIPSAGSNYILNWEDPADSDFDHIEIDWFNGHDTNTATIAKNIESCTLTNLHPLIENIFRIRTVDTAGNKSAGAVFYAKAVNETLDPDTRFFINTADDLNAIRGDVSGYEEWGLNGQYILMKDIDLSTFDAGDGKGWMPVGKDTSGFTGILDGNSYSVTNIQINRPDTVNVGLFGVITTGTVKRLGITGGTITGSYYTGGIVGISNAGTIERCFTTCNVTSTLDCAGALAGYNDGTINDSYATGTITTPFETSYLIGTDNTKDINRSYFAAGSLSKVYHTYTPTSWIIYCTDEEMRNISTFTNAGWDFHGETINGTEDTWTIDSGTNNGYPYHYKKIP